MSTTVRYPVIRNARSSETTEHPQSVIDTLFNHLIHNPTDHISRHALAEELEDQGRNEDAALLRQSIEDKARAIRKYRQTANSRLISDPLSNSDHHHLSSALWTLPEGNAGVDDVNPDVLASMLDDWHRFRAQHRGVIEDLNENQAAHDFWLSRNGHGAGYLGDTGYEDGTNRGTYYRGHHNKLQEAARKYGEFNLIGPEPVEGQWTVQVPSGWGEDRTWMDHSYHNNEEDAQDQSDMLRSSRVVPPDDHDERGRTITGTSYVNTDNEGPQRMSRIKYAAPAEKYVPMTPEQEEAALLEGIHKNPDDLSIHHAYAEVLDEQGRHGEAELFRSNPIISYGARNQEGSYYNVSHAFLSNSMGDEGRPRMDSASFSFERDVPGKTEPPPGLHNPHNIPLSDPSWWWRYPHKMQIRFMEGPVLSAKKIIDALDAQGIGHRPYSAYDTTYRLRIKNAKPIGEVQTYMPKEPQQYAAYRAPKGGAVVRGTYYQGGKLIPDLEGDFANPPVSEQPVVEYPQPKQSLRDRLKSKFGRKEPLVVSYARAPKSKPPAHLPQLFDAVRRLDYINPDLTIRNALAEELADLGRHKEVELLNSGRYAIDLNGGGKVVKAPPPRAINTATRRGFAGTARFAGISYRQLREQLDHGRTRRIGNNREIANGPDGDIHVHLHGNHVVTAHPDGSYSLFAGQWHTPTTFAVHQEITGERPNRVRGMTMFRDEPFEEGVRFTPGQDG